MFVNLFINHENFAIFINFLQKIIENHINDVHKEFN
jgi:hypothetical protein